MRCMRHLPIARFALFALFALLSMPAAAAPILLMPDRVFDGEAMRRAVLAGVDVIEHGSEGDGAVFALTAQRKAALCPALAAGDAIARYRGWTGVEPAPRDVQQDRGTFALALKSVVPICMGGDVGVFTHGTNAREMLLMARAGMANIGVLVAATAGNARAGQLRRDRQPPGLAPRSDTPRHQPPA